jgi:dTDP-4-amino-4,6-dideoxy-D-galactose acyltransferase
MIPKYKLTLREWDCHFFDRKIYDVSWENTQDVIDISEHGLITTKLDSRETKKIEILNRDGFNYCEGEVYLKKDVLKNNFGPSFEYTIAKKEDIRSILGFTTNLYKNSRFKSPWFSSKERNKFYQEWLVKAVHGTFDNCCLIVKQGKKITGFITLRYSNSSATIGLLGVNPSFAGQGIGSYLLTAAEDHLKSKNIITIGVSTQTSNIPALNLYVKSGYHINCSSIWLYKGTT